MAGARALDPTGRPPRGPAPPPRPHPARRPPRRRPCDHPHRRHRDRRTELRPSRRPRSAGGAPRVVGPPIQATICSRTSQRRSHRTPGSAADTSTRTCTDHCLASTTCRRQTRSSHRCEACTQRSSSARISSSSTPWSTSSTTVPISSAPSWVQFSNGSDSSQLVGTTRVRWSQRVTTILVSPMSETRPHSPRMTTTSSMRTGSLVATIRPDTRFWRGSRRARPSTTPITPA